MSKKYSLMLSFFLFLSTGYAGTLTVGPEHVALTEVTLLVAERVILKGSIDTQGHELKIVAREIEFKETASIRADADDVQIYAGSIIGKPPAGIAKAHYGKYFTHRDGKLFEDKFDVHAKNFTPTYSTIAATYVVVADLTLQLNRARRLGWMVRDLSPDIGGNRESNLESAKRRIEKQFDIEKLLPEAAALYSQMVRYIDSEKQGAAAPQSLAEISSVSDKLLESSYTTAIDAMKKVLIEVVQLKDYEPKENAPEVMGSAFSIYAPKFLADITSGVPPGSRDEIEFISPIKSVVSGISYDRATGIHSHD